MCSPGHFFFGEIKENRLENINAYFDYNVVQKFHNLKLSKSADCCSNQVIEIESTTQQQNTARKQEFRQKLATPSIIEATLFYLKVKFTITRIYSVTIFFLSGFGNIHFFQQELRHFLGN